MIIEAVDQSLEVNRDAVQVVVDGFRGFTLLANRILIDEGVGNDDGEGNLDLPPGAWLNLYRYLRALRRIEEEVGASVLQSAGQTIPKHARFPPTVVDIYSALASLDVAYHMNHRKDGRVLFDPAHGVIGDYIGNYLYRRTKGDSKVELVSDTPYACPYDLGIVQGLAQRYQPTAKVAHGPGCRSKGGQNCTYVINVA